MIIINILKLTFILLSSEKVSRMTPNTMFSPTVVTIIQKQMWKTASTAQLRKVSSV